MTYWIYTLDSNLYKTFQDKNYLSAYDSYPVEPNDIILLYLKEKNNTGFISIYKALTIMDKNNNNIQIFTDDNLNRYCVKLELIKSFKSVIINSVVTKIFTDVPGHRNISSFTGKYLKDTCKFVRIEYNYDVLYKNILNYVAKVEKDENIIDEDSEDEVEEGGQDEEGDEEVEDEVEEEDEDEVEDEVEEEDKVVESEEEEDEEEIKEEIKEKIKQKKTSNNNIIKNSNINGEIPVLIITCYNFKINKNKNAKYVIDHLKMCPLCNLVDNNPITLHFILNSVKPINLDFKEITVKTNKNDLEKYFEKPLADYHSLTKHNLLDVNNKNESFIRITYINNGDDVYESCLLATFII